MILLDIRTIIFSHIITDIVCVIVMTILWRQTRKRFAVTGFFVLDFALQTVAFFLIVLRGSIPNWSSIVLSNTMVLAGAIIGYMGLTRFTGKKSSQIHNYILLAVFVPVHAYFTLVQPNLAARNLNVSLGLLIICFQCAWLMLYRVEPEKRQLTRGVGIVFCFYCLVSLIRVAEFFLYEHSINDFFQSNFFDQYVLISHQMLLVLLTFSLAMMFNKRLLLDITSQEEKFSKAFHSSPYAITITRLSDGQIIEVNDGFLNITGYQSADVKENTTIGMHLWVKDEDRALVVSELASKGMVHEREFQFRKKSGERITGLFSADIIKINNETCVLSSINDITDRKWAEDARRDSEIRFRELFNRISSGVAVYEAVDNGGDFIFRDCNPAVEKIEKVSRKDILGKRVSEVFPGVKAFGVFAVFQRVWQTGKSEHFPENIYKDARNPGSWRESWILKLPSGEIVAIYNDITERKQAEEEVLRLNKELENKVANRTRDLRNNQLALLSIVEDLNVSNKKVAVANHALDTTNKELESFSYSVSHDLRAPLRSIDGFSLALLEDYQNKLDDTGRNYLNRIRTAAQHMGLLIDDILKLSRITHAEFRNESIDLSQEVQSIADTLQQNNPDKDMKIIIQKDIVINGDLRSMRIALTNMLENAWKFTAKQKNPLIEFGMTLKDEKKVFFIRDNGVGFDMAYVNKLFGAFQRLHKTSDFPGTGIGLATVKRIITRHGGQIWTEGEVGKGATFYFTLPE